MSITIANIIQVCRIIDKNLEVLKSNIGSERTKERNGNYNESLCCKTESEG